MDAFYKIFGDLSKKEKTELALAYIENPGSVQVFIDGDWADKSGWVSFVDSVCYRIRPKPTLLVGKYYQIDGKDIVYCPQYNYYVRYGASVLSHIDNVPLGVSFVEVDFSPVKQES